MTDPEQSLVFKSNGLLYALPATGVLQVIKLPALTPVEEQPPFVAGVFAIANRMVPVIDLNTRFGHPARPYTIDMCVIILDSAQGPRGLLVDDVLDMELLNWPEPGSGASETASSLVIGETRLAEELVMLLSLAHLFDFDIDAPEVPEVRAVPTFAADASAEDREIFQRRAKALQEEAESPLPAGAFLVAVLLIRGERYAMGINQVSYFTEIETVVPLPGAPRYLRGQISSRGDIITVIDLLSLLGLPMTSSAAVSKVVVIDHQGVKCGFCADDIIDVVSLNPDDIQTVPVGHSMRNADCIIGEYIDASGNITVVDVERLVDVLHAGHSSAQQGMSREAAR